MRRVPKTIARFLAGSVLLLAGLALTGCYTQLAVTETYDERYRDPDYVEEEVYEEDGEVVVHKHYYYDDWHRPYRFRRYFYRFYDPFYYGFYDPFFYDPFFYDPFYYHSGFHISIGFGFGYPYWRYHSPWYYRHHYAFYPYGGYYWDPFYYGGSRLVVVKPPRTFQPRGGTLGRSMLADDRDGRRGTRGYDRGEAGLNDRQAGRSVVRTTAPGTSAGKDEAPARSTRGVIRSTDARAGRSTDGRGMSLRERYTSRSGSRGVVRGTPRDEADEAAARTFYRNRSTWISSRGETRPEERGGSAVRSRTTTRGTTGSYVLPPRSSEGTVRYVPPPSSEQVRSRSENPAPRSSGSVERSAPSSRSSGSVERSAPSSRSSGSVSRSSGGSSRSAGRSSSSRGGRRNN
ncbi:hypothetical protein GQ464_014515 [Rhodocaloribacter litoris]|uniref:hypothetical protein n=1 Tax=Rhodocaloribacter litoris TaxID=2558931 RepID=UPI0014236A76|nr:hypothetical protein [Rhodocaloribacter litoris]QXD14629.1 hypothetical protein GQ464_014515 [Rhodocaloribacter litoris]